MMSVQMQLAHVSRDDCGEKFFSEFGFDNRFQYNYKYVAVIVATCRFVVLKRCDYYVGRAGPTRPSNVCLLATWPAIK